MRVIHFLVACASPAVVLCAIDGWMVIQAAANGMSTSAIAEQLCCTPRLFIEPRFLCTQTPKHTVSLKRPKYTLCEKKFRYELKLGRESTNPTFKGTPQPPL